VLTDEAPRKIEDIEGIMAGREFQGNNRIEKCVRIE